MTVPIKTGLTDKRNITLTFSFTLSGKYLHNYANYNLIVVRLRLVSLVVLKVLSKPNLVKRGRNTQINQGSHQSLLCSNSKAILQRALVIIMGCLQRDKVKSKLESDFVPVPAS